jgi:Motility quorum-sensing regulator, toxin of MqsA
MTAADGADELGMDEQAVADVIAELAAVDFDKSMPSEINPAVWQGVYRPVVGGCALLETGEDYLRALFKIAR